MAKTLPHDGKENWQLRRPHRGATRDWYYYRGYSVYRIEDRELTGFDQNPERAEEQAEMRRRARERRGSAPKEA